MSYTKVLIVNDRPFSDIDINELCVNLLKCNVCRLCLCSSKELVEKCQNSDFIKSVQLITGINLSESFFYPLKICNECIVKIDEIIKYREICLQSDSKLRLISKTHSIVQVIGTIQDDVKLQTHARELVEILKRETKDNIRKIIVEEIKPKAIEIEIKQEYECDSDGGMDDLLIDTRSESFTDDEFKINNDSIDKKPLVNYLLKGVVKGSDKLKKNKEKALKGKCGLNVQGIVAEVKGIIPEDNEELLKLKETDPNAYVKEKSKRICPVCNKVYCDGRRLRNHYTRVHEAVKKYVCELCGKAFVEAAGLKQHSVTHKEAKPYICKICGHTTRTLMCLKTHMRTHRPDERPFKCDICQMTFRSSSHKTRHVKLHDDPTPYKCDICDKKFRWLRSLRDHKNAIHEGQRKYCCEMCPARFGFREPLRQHRKVVHGMMRTQKSVEIMNERNRNKCMIETADIQPIQGVQKNGIGEQTPIDMFNRTTEQRSKQDGVV